MFPAAARSLYREFGLDCDDARPLVGSPEVGLCGQALVVLRR